MLWWQVECICFLKQVSTMPGLCLLCSCNYGGKTRMRLSISPRERKTYRGAPACPGVGFSRT